MHLRDRLISFFGLAVLSILVAASAYYAIKSNFDDGSPGPNKDSPDFATRDCVVTIFDRDGTGKHRLFSEYAEHYSDGHSVSIRPKLVTLSPDKPQLKMSANTASTMDEGQTVVFTGNIVLTRSQCPAPSDDIACRCQYRHTGCHGGSSRAHRTRQ